MAAGEMTLLTLAETAHWLRVNKATLYRLIQKRGIPFFKIGRLYRFDEAEVERWMNRDER